MSRNDKISRPFIFNWTPHIAQFPRMVIGCDSVVSKTLRSSPCTDQWSLRPRPLPLTNSDQCVTSQGGQPPVIGQLRTPGGQSANSSPPSHTQNSVLVTALHTHNVHHCTHTRITFSDKMNQTLCNYLNILMNK